jgi:hypothetical protein
MALTTVERRVVNSVLDAELAARKAAGDDTTLGEFFDLTLVQQKNFLRPRVQTIRDGAQTTFNGVDAAAAAQKARLTAELAILDGLLVKLAP